MEKQKNDSMSILMDFKGATKEIKLLCGDLVTIREQNGEDDSVISKMKDARTGENISKFLASIIVGFNGSDARLSHKEINEWKVSDKYYLMIHSRILSLGPDLHFEHVCQNAKCSKKTAYDENLLAYIIPDKKSKEDVIKLFEDNPNKPLAYPKGSDTERDFITRSGKKVKYKFLNSGGEKYMINMDPEETNVNMEYTKRDLQLYHNNEYQSISNFAIFSSRDMMDIRSDVAKNDPVFEAISDIICPHCNLHHTVSLVAVTDFFYPVLT